MGASDLYVLENLSCPLRGAMKFHLIYSGPLSASGNKSKLAEAHKIREKLHEQMKYLWDTHSRLQRLKRSARVPSDGGGVMFWDDPMGVSEKKELRPLKKDEVDLCAPIQRGDKAFVPLVRQSLSVTCSLDILFLRQEDPCSLVLQGGDLDNRVKTLFDALRMPEPNELDRHAPSNDITYCLLESDTLISGVSIVTDRLLFPRTLHPNEVHLVIHVDLTVTRVGQWNITLVGG